MKAGASPPTSIGRPAGSDGGSGGSPEGGGDDGPAEKTGEAEIITVNGEARAVLLSPAVYDEMAREVQLSRDAAVIRRALQQYEAGPGQELHAARDEVRATLLAMKAAKQCGKEGGEAKGDAGPGEDEGREEERRTPPEPVTRRAGD